MTLLNSAASELASMVGCARGLTSPGSASSGTELRWQKLPDVDLEFRLQQVPFFSGAGDYAKLGTFPGGTLDNQNFFGDRVEFEAGITEAEQLLLFDAQTSGGLLLAVPEEQIDEMVDRAASDEIPVWRIGTVRDGSGKLIVGK